MLETAQLLNQYTWNHLIFFSSECFASTLMKQLNPIHIAFELLIITYVSLPWSNTASTAELNILISGPYDWSWHERVTMKAPPAFPILLSIPASRVPSADMIASKHVKCLTCSTTTSSTLILIVYTSVWKAIELLSWSGNGCLCIYLFPVLHLLLAYWIKIFELTNFWNFEITKIRKNCAP